MDLKIYCHRWLADLGTRRSCQQCQFSKKLDSLIPQLLQESWVSPEGKDNNNNNNWESNKEKSVMSVTASALEDLCSKSMISLTHYITVKLQQVWRIIVDELTHSSYKVHVYGYAFLLEPHASYRLQCNIPSAKLSLWV